MPKYTYIKGSKTNSEFVKFSVVERLRSEDGEIVTCFVDIPFLLCGSDFIISKDVWGVCRPYGMLTPQQKLEILEFVREERKKIIGGYEVKTYEGWKESGLERFDDYCFPGDKVDSELIKHFTSLYPPVAMGYDCIQPNVEFNEVKDEAGNSLDTYMTFHQTPCGWIFDGYCFLGDTKNRVTYVPKLERKIKELRKLLDPDSQIV